MTLAACGGGGGTTAASSTAATSTASKTTATTAHGSSKRSKQPHRRARRALTAQARRGRRAGQRICADVSRADALAHFLAVAEAAEKHHHVAARAGMIARIKQLPKSAYNGTGAPAMAAGLVATGLPLKQRSGGFAGCVAALGGLHNGSG